MSSFLPQIANQFLQTMAGVIWNIAELEKIDPKTYKNRIAVVLIADGYEKLSDDFLDKMDQFELIDKALLNRHAKMTNQNSKTPELIKFKKLEKLVGSQSTALSASSKKDGYKNRDFFGVGSSCKPCARLPQLTFFHSWTSRIASRFPENIECPIVFDFGLEND